MDMMMDGFKPIEMKACGHLTKETNVDRSVVIAATFEGNRIVQMMCNGGNYINYRKYSTICDKNKWPTHCFTLIYFFPPPLPPASMLFLEWYSLHQH